ncbi:MAG: GNAT family N-acetyltransferase [Chitinophagaceae bacterium]|nr:MAG: GNAT family N-acetyltransferase [Chitinophagaceae bacterium]
MENMTGLKETIRETAIEQVLAMRHCVMYPDQTVEAMRLPDDGDGLHLGLYEGPALMSVVSLFPRGDALQFRKFATETASQGKGYGTKLLTYVMEYAAAGTWTSIWCNARLSAAGFYRRFGMEVTGESWEQFGIGFIKMEKQLK